MSRLANLRDLAIIMIGLLALAWSIYGVWFYIGSPDPVGRTKDVATIIGVAVAVVTYVTNSMAQHRQRIIENVRRFNEAHLSLFAKGKFLHEKYRSMDEGESGRPTLKINREDPGELTMFHEFLGEIEHFAMLQEVGAISKTGNAYFFGWYAKQIKPLLDEERGEPFWQLAVRFIDDMAAEGQRFTTMAPADQARYISKRMFLH